MDGSEDLYWPVFMTMTYYLNLSIKIYSYGLNFMLEVI